MILVIVCAILTIVSVLISGFLSDAYAAVRGWVALLIGVIFILIVASLVYINMWTPLHPR